jgi:DNA polymerase-1
MTHTNKPPLWLLVDGNNVVQADAHAPNVGVAKAAATLNRRLELLNAKWSTAFAIAVWDCDSPTFRHRLFAEYKQGRKRLVGIDRAIDECKEIFREHAFANMDAPGFEADDLLATLRDEAISDGARVVIYSSDRDLHQLLAEGETSIVKKVRRTGDELSFEFLTAAGLLEKYKVRPDQWVDFKILTGDPSDGIPGIDHIGAVTAGNLLATCGSLDAFFANPFKAPLSDRQRAKIMNAKSRLPMLRGLCQLRHDVPLPELWKESV